MKITIDTKEDSHDEIRKLIRMLQHLIREQPVTNQPNIFEDPNSFGVSSQDEVSSTSSQGNVFGNIFDTPTQTENSEPSQTKEQAPETEEKREETPNIIPY